MADKQEKTAGADRGGRSGAGRSSGGGENGSRKRGAGAGAGELPREPAKSGRGGQRSSKSPDLRKDLRDFASGRPQGWEHEDWLSFLESLRGRGHNVHDAHAIGVALEKERLDVVLGGIKGVGPQRRQALVERYATVWNLRNADVDEIASVAKVPRTLAEQIKTGMT